MGGAGGQLSRQSVIGTLACSCLFGALNFHTATSNTGQEHSFPKLILSASTQTAQGKGGVVEVFPYIGSPWVSFMDSSGLHRQAAPAWPGMAGFR